MYNSIFSNIFAEDHENEDMPIKIHLLEYLSYTNHKYDDSFQYSNISPFQFSNNVNYI